MFDHDKTGEEFDLFMEKFGCPPPIGVGLFDRRLLLSREQVPEWVERDSGEAMSLDEIDSAERDEIFHWHRHDGGDGPGVGVPMYMPYRIGLCRRLRREGWTPEEIKELVEWEEWVVTDMLEGDLPYEDDDRLLVLSEHRERLEMLESERISRLPVEERPGDWASRGWTSDVKAMGDDTLTQELEQLRSVVRSLEKLDLEKARPKTVRGISRRAYQLRMHHEDVRFIAVVSDRMRYEAGFSPNVGFEGPHALLGDPTRLETFGRVDWYRTLRSWRIMNDPDHAPVRLPGFVCIGGDIRMPNPLTPELYAERYSLFRLDQYRSTFEELVSGRRCQHCDRPLVRHASEKRLYCNPKCSQAHRQKRHRARAKADILNRRTTTRGQRSSA